MSEYEVDSKAPILLSYSCNQKWQEMEGDESKRACELCQCKVQNIDGYSEIQIAQLLEQVDQGQKICVAFTKAAFRSNIPQALRKNRTDAALQALHENWSDISFNFVPNSQDTGVQLPSIFSVTAIRTSVSLLLATSIGVTNSAKGSAAEILKYGALNSIPSYHSHHPHKLGARLTLEAEERGGWVGRPAPNEIRDKVEDLTYYEYQKYKKLPNHLLHSFITDINSGHISIPKLRLLAKRFEREEDAGGARRCYSLLLALAERENANKNDIKDVNERIRLLLKKEYAAELICFDGEVRKRDFRQAKERLFKVDNARRMALKFGDVYPWKDFETRLDFLSQQKVTEAADTIFGWAMSIADDYPSSKEMEDWKERQRKRALAQINTWLTQENADAGSAIMLAQEDEELKRRCEFIPALQNLYGRLESAKGEARAAIQRSLLKLSDEHLIGSEATDWQEKLFRKISTEIEEHLKISDGYSTNDCERTITELDKAEKLLGSEPWISRRYSWDNFAKRYLYLAENAPFRYRFYFWRVLFTNPAQDVGYCSESYNSKSLVPRAADEWKRCLEAFYQLMAAGKPREAREIIKYCCRLQELNEELSQRCDWIQVVNGFFALIVKTQVVDMEELEYLHGFISRQPDSKEKRLFIQRVNEKLVEKINDDLEKVRKVTDKNELERALDNLQSIVACRQIDKEIKARCPFSDIVKSSGVLKINMPKEEREYVAKRVAFLKALEESFK